VHAQSEKGGGGGGGWEGGESRERYKPSPPTRERVHRVTRGALSRALSRGDACVRIRALCTRHVVDVQVYVSRAHMRRLVYLANAIPELFICLLPGSASRENASLYVRANTPREPYARVGPPGVVQGLPGYVAVGRARSVRSLSLSLSLSLSRSFFFSRRPPDLSDVCLRHFALTLLFFSLSFSH